MTVASAVSRGCLFGYRGTTRARDKLFSLAVSHAFARFGRRTVVQLPVRLVGERRIALGSGIFVGAGSWLQTLGDSDEIALEIGDRTSIAGSCVISAVSSIRIGERVTIARGTYIADHAHAYDRPEIPIADQGLANIAAVEIRDGAWIAENAVISPGVTIGAGAVVGANSVVTNDIPAHCLALGTPARVIRRFAQETPTPQTPDPLPA
jgi:acetyltransferase-like isoleucine patch superfamily enzyme